MPPYFALEAKMLINGEDYDLKFGLRFIKTAKEIYCPDGIEYAGLKMEMDITYGVSLMAIHLQTGVAPAIANCIYCATSHLVKQPSLEDIDVYIEAEIEKGRSVKQQCDDFFELLKSAPLLKAGLDEYMKSLDGFVELIAKIQTTKKPPRKKAVKSGGRTAGQKSTKSAI